MAKVFVITGPSGVGKGTLIRALIARVPALGEAADRLGRGDPAGREDLVDLDAPVLRDRQQEVEDLGCLEVLGRVEQQLVDRLATGLQVTLELGPTAADVVGALQRLHPLHERAFRGGDGFGWRFTERRHGGRLYIVRAADPTPERNFG